MNDTTKTEVQDCFPNIAGSDGQPRFFSPKDGERLFRLLLLLRKLSIEMNLVLEEHAECPGCDLCCDCDRQQYMLQMFEGMFTSMAYGDEIERVEAALGLPDWYERESPKPSTVQAPPSVPAPSPHAELPPAKARPYWLQ